MNEEMKRLLPKMLKQVEWHTASLKKDHADMLAQCKRNGQEPTIQSMLR